VKFEKWNTFETSKVPNTAPVGLQWGVSTEYVPGIHLNHM
jgi:hypothetical protein